MKIVFLDIDGTLTRELEGQVGWEGVDSRCVEVLNALVANDQIQIVIISVWRAWRGHRESGLALLRQFNIPIVSEASVDSFANDHTYEAVASNLRKIGCVGKLHTDWATPGLTGRPRSEEVEAWLMDHPETEAYVILDDFEEQFINHSHLVKVDPAVGLTSADLKKARQILAQGREGS